MLTEIEEKIRMSHSLAADIHEKVRKDERYLSFIKKSADKVFHGREIDSALETMRWALKGQPVIPYITCAIYRGESHSSVPVLICFRSEEWAAIRKVQELQLKEKKQNPEKVLVRMVHDRMKKFRTALAQRNAYALDSSGTPVPPGYPVFGHSAQSAAMNPNWGSAVYDNISLLDVLEKFVRKEECNIQDRKWAYVYEPQFKSLLKLYNESGMTESVMRQALDLIRCEEVMAE